MADRLAQVDEEIATCLRFLFDFLNGVVRARRQPEFDSGARDPHFLPFDHVSVPFRHCDRLDFRGKSVPAPARSRPSTAGAARRRDLGRYVRFCFVQPWRSIVTHVGHGPWHAPELAARAVDLFHDH